MKTIKVWPLFWALVAFSVSLAARAATISTVGTIPGANDGSVPFEGLTELGGQYYGTTSTYGSSYGTVYRLDLKTGVETIIHVFNDANSGNDPAGLIAVRGKLYGTAENGNGLGGGSVFSLDPTTGAIQTIYSLPTGTYIGLSFEYKGLLYGSGFCGSFQVSCIYTFDAAASTGQIVYSFSNSADGDYVTGLTLHGQYMYGLTNSSGSANEGTLFQFDPATSTLRLEHTFGKGSDGSQPDAVLIDVGGILYGTTSYGGTDGYGTVFSFDPDTRQEAVLHSFDYSDGEAANSGLLSFGGLLYGVTQGGGMYDGGVLFSVDPTNGQTQTVYNFSYPDEEPTATLVAANGLLYSTLFTGGAADQGIVYSVDPASGSLKTLHSFAGQETSSTSGVIKVDASLYGTASGGGSGGLGSIFKVYPATGAIETVHSFNGLDGARPMAPLIDVAGILYGTTSAGASSFAGTVFSFDPATRKLTTLYQFNGSADGGSPTCALSLDNGALYGTTSQNDGAYFGTVFKVDLASGAFSTVFSGNYDTFILPYGVVSANGFLYGSATSDTHPDGTLYQFDPATGMLSTLYAFQGGADGTFPNGGLLYSNGMLFGETQHYQSPTSVIGFNLATGSKTVVQNFNEHLSLDAPLIAAGDKLFGIAYSRAAPHGAVLRLKATGGGVQLYPFASAMGGNPEAPLLHVGQAFYGTTPSSDTTNAGTVFKFMP